MKKILLSYCLLFLFFTIKAQEYPQEIKVTDNGEFAVMYMGVNRIHILNTFNGQLIKHRLPDSLKVYGGIQLYNSMILVQCIKYGSPSLLLDFMGRPLYTFSTPVIAAPSGKGLYEVMRTEVRKLDSNFKVNKTITLENNKLSEFYEIDPMRCYLSNDEQRIAVCLKKMGGMAIAVFDLSNGKLIAIFDKFKDTEKKKLEFAGLSPDGKYLVAGNRFVVSLMDIDKGNIVGTFEENPKNNRKYFTAAGFVPDSKKAIIVSQYKIYSLGLDKFEAMENINFGGEKTIKVVTTYEGFLNKKLYETTDYEYSMNNYYYWCGYDFSKDGKLLYAGIELVNEAGRHTTLINKMTFAEPAKNIKYLLK